MAAIDLPVRVDTPLRLIGLLTLSPSPQFNDAYLSHLHQVRNASKAALRADRSTAAAAAAAALAVRRLGSLSEEGELSILERMTPEADVPGGESTVPSFGLYASDSAVLSHYPTPLLRLMVLLSPTIHAAARFVHLATWTGGPGTASHSFSLVLGWWAMCLYGYEVIRYCPQLALLALLASTGIVGAYRSTQGRSPPKQLTVHQTAALASSDSLNATINELALLADFTSTLYSTLVAPATALICWHEPSQTLAFLMFLITSWPVWLILFSGSLAQVWDLLGLTAITRSVYVDGSRVAAVIGPYARAHLSVLLSAARSKSPGLALRTDQGLALLTRAHGYADAYILPQVCAVTGFASHQLPLVLRTAPGPHVGIFPILSLRVRHLLLVLGTVALTWCSPWCALIRHALWRSALVRRATRFTWACLSGQIFFGHQSSASLYRGSGRLTLGPHGEPVALGSKEAALFDTSAAEDTLIENRKEADGSNLTRHEDVVYQFTIFENQRWWMGLDWTAALLPQERPSWADESNSPVSPPSSFSLPPPKTTLKPTPTSSDRNSHTKRLIRWQWIDPEWTVAGRDAPGDAAGGKANSAASVRRASTTSAASATSGTSDVTSASAAARAAADLVVDPTWLDVDAEGWQYGDNGWEKMSKKAGMGRYTRRRRWVRRAVLVEVVQTDYHPAADELTGSAVLGDSNLSPPFWSDGGAANKSTESAPSSPDSKRAELSPVEGGLKERLARAASSGASVGTAPEASATPASPSAENGPDLNKANDKV